MTVLNNIGRVLYVEERQLSQMYDQHTQQTSALGMQICNIFLATSYISFKCMHYLLRQVGGRMIEDGLKVGDSFGSDVTKIKYCALKGLVWSPQSREYILTIRKIHLRCILWRVIIFSGRIGFFCFFFPIVYMLLQHINSAFILVFLFILYYFLILACKLYILKNFFVIKLTKIRQLLC